MRMRLPPDIIITAAIVLAIIVRAAMPTMPPSAIAVGLMIIATAIARRLKG